MNFRYLTERPHTRAILAALAFALTAQYLFTGEWFSRNNGTNGWAWGPRYNVAVGLLLIALIYASVAARRETPEQSDASTGEPKKQALDKRLTYWLAGAGGCYALSIIVYLAYGENPLMQLLWLASVGLLIIPLWRRAGSQTDSPPIARWEWVLVALLTGIGFFLRYWQLTEIPSHVDNDVSLMGSYGLDLLQSNNYNWIGFSYSEHLLSYDQLTAWSMRLFGENHYGVVMRSVLFGTASLPLVFLLGREMFNTRVGLIAMALQTIEYTPIQFSRILFGPSATFFALLVFYLLYRGLRTRKRLWFALAGAATGLGLLFYDSGRVIPLITLGILGWQLVWQRETVRANFANWAFYSAGALVSFGPMLAFAFLNFSEFNGRGNTVALWAPDIWQHSVNKYAAASAGDVLLAQIQRTFLTFHYYGDGSPHFTFPKPMVSALTATLLILGLGYCFSRIRQTRYFILAAWLLLTLVMGGVLTYDPPYWPHLTVALPAVALIAGLAADRLINALMPSSEATGGLGRDIILFVGLSALIFTAVNNWQVYYAHVKNNAGPRVRVARYINSLPEGYTVYFVHDDLDWSEYTFRFLNRGVPGEDATIEGLETQPPPLDKPLLFILIQHQESLPQLQGHYPTGTAVEHFDADGQRAFVSLAVVPEGQGYLLKPRVNKIDTWNLPGWWLIGGVLAALGGWAGYRFWQARRTAPAPSPVDLPIIRESKP